MLTRSLHFATVTAEPGHHNVERPDRAVDALYRWVGRSPIRGIGPRSRPRPSTTSAHPAVRRHDSSEATAKSRAQVGIQLRLAGRFAYSCIVHASTPAAATTSEDLVSGLGEELLATVLRLKRIGARVLDEWHTSVTMPQLAVLGRLHSCGPQRLSTIADWSQLDRSSASRQITELADRGLVDA